MPERPSEPPHSQPEFELAEPTGLAPVLLHLREQLAQQSQPVLHLVIVLLAHHEAHPGGIDRARVSLKAAIWLFSQPSPPPEPPSWGGAPGFAAGCGC